MAYRRSPLMQERLADNRERILRAARTLIARGGFREASIAAVAQEVGRSTGAIYRYFPSKAGLFVELLTDDGTGDWPTKSIGNCSKNSRCCCGMWSRMSGTKFAWRPRCRRRSLR